MGNICRSPAAEAVFLKRLEATDIADQVAVDSAGTTGYHADNRPMLACRNTPIAAAINWSAAPAK